MTTLYLIRHAQCSFEDKVHKSDWKLSNQGQKQVMDLTKNFRLLDINYIYSSPFIGSIETVLPLSACSGVSIAIHEDLREKTTANGYLDNFEEIKTKCAENFNYELPDLETTSMAQGRIVRVLTEIAKRHVNKNILISSHETILNTFLSHINPSNSKKLAMCEIIKIIHCDDNFFIENLQPEFAI